MFPEDDLMLPVRAPVDKHPMQRNAGFANWRREIHRKPADQAGFFLVIQS